MKSKKNQAEPKIMLSKCACEFCGFTEGEILEFHTAEDVLVVLKNKMTAMELVRVIEALSEMASELTVSLAKACGTCNNCDDEGKEICKRINDCDEACAAFHGCKDGPVEWVADCALCQNMLDENQGIHIPDYVLEAAGIPKGTKLEAYADEDSGEITVTRAEQQYDIRDVPQSILTVLAQSGVCLAELDELIMQGVVVYGI